MMTIASAARTLSWISVMAAGIAWAGEPSRPFADALQQVDALARFRPVVKVGSFSSYDRSGGNDDGFSGKHSFLRKEGDGLVIAELHGPGVLTRIWTPTPTTDPLEFYFDGETSPRLRLPFLELFGGERLPFVAPLSGRGGGGYYCYVPLEFAKSIKVVFRGPKLQFYQINYALYEPDVPARSYRPGDSFPAPTVTPTGKTIRSQHVLSPDKPITVFETTQPGRIVSLKLGPAEALADQDRRVVLRMSWDGSARPAVEVPAGDFFGASFGDPAACSLLLGTKEGWSYTNFPMPFDRSARIELVSERGSGGPDVTITSEVVWQDRPREAAEGWFQAVWHRENPTQAGQPFTFLDVKGRGHLVGVTLQAQGAKPGDTGFFEGDDQATIDGELTVHGTGSEDFFNGGWYILPGRWDDRATFLLSGCLDYQLHLARTGGYRLFLADAYCFHRSLLLTIEHGPVGNQVVTDYTGVTYFYLDRAGGEAAPLPSVQARAVTPPKGFVIVPAWVGPIRSFSMDHATIGRVAEQIDGQTVRFLSLRQDGPPSLLQHFVALTADVPRSGRYVVSAVGIAGPDAGIVQMLRDDQPIGKPVDFYAPRRGKTDLLRLAEIDLTRGPNHLFFALVGKNEKSTGKGFDLVEIHCQLAENGKGGSSAAAPLP